jgi:TolA-binding protein
MHAALLGDMRGKYILGVAVLVSACATTTPPPANTAAHSTTTVALAEPPGARRDPHAEDASQQARKTRARVEAAQVQQQIRQLESPGH